jgi:hypothetical protein
MKHLVIGCSAVLLAAVTSTAHAESFGEGVVGVALPMGDDDYENAVDNSFKLGFRGGSVGAGGLGFEIALDWTPANDDLSGEILGQTFDVDWHRFRTQVGIRGGTRVGKSKNVFVFGRAVGGMDLVYTSTTVTILGNTTDDSDTDIGLALELGGGVLVDVGAVALGFQVAVPMGFHFDEADQDEDIDYDYSSYDIDLLATISSGF